ncbi:hypothetical protein FOA52_002343 [Chlamydomonas sp. UWO 241]|nr:hypothetical protein FOA52_002343 [Chlamydomonas sp. UWO 241]
MSGRRGGSRKRGADAIEAGVSTTTSKDPCASTSFTWRIEGFSKLTKGYDGGEGTHLAVFLEAQDDMWEPSTEYKITVVNQADAMLTVDVTVEREDRSQLDTGGAPCDVTLKLPCGVEIPTHGQLLRLASPLFSEALEDGQGGASIPVDGSFGAWTYIRSCLYPLHDKPKLTLGSVYNLLPVAHKYNFTKLLTRLMDFVKEGTLSPDPAFPASYIIRWLALAERLQLDELCLGWLQGMTREDLDEATTVEVAVGSGADMQMKHVVRQEVKGLVQALRDELFVLTAHAT